MYSRDYFHCFGFFFLQLCNNCCLYFSAKCSLDCGKNGQCEEGHCRCDTGWTGARCDQKTCDDRCHDHGQCKNGTCVCVQGWMGTHCTLG